MIKARVRSLGLPLSLILAYTLEEHWSKEHPFQTAWLDYWEEKEQRSMRVGRALRMPISELVPEYLRR